MVVIAACVCSKTRKAYFSRQFIEVRPSRIETLMTAFTNVKTTGTQHSFVELYGVRFIYQPLDEVIVVVLTNKSSNIYRDLKALSLLANMVTEICKSSKENVVMEKAFEIMLCFDEVFSAGGYSENCVLEDIIAIQAAESKDEKMHDEISKSKEREAKEELRRKARFIKQRKNEESKSSLLQHATDLGKNFQMSINLLGRSQIQTVGNTQPYIALDKTQPILQQQHVTEPQISAVLQEKNKVVPFNLNDERDPAVLRESVHVFIREIVKAVITRDGSIEGFSINGGINLRITDKSKSDLRLELDIPKTSSSFTSKTHPYIDKKIFNSQSALVLSNPSKTFPVNQSLDVLKWMYNENDESKLPITVSFWLSRSDATGLVTIEYETVIEDLNLNKLLILIPVPSPYIPEIKDHSGTCQYDPRKGLIMWENVAEDSIESTGLLEFTVDIEDSDILFPMEISFRGYRSYSGIKINRVCKSGDKTPLDYSSECIFLSEKYTIT